MSHPQSNLTAPLCCLSAIALWIVLSLVAVSAQSRRITSEQAASVSNRSKEVQLTITVRDSFGKPVAGLTAEDFLIYADGQQYVPIHCEQRRAQANIVLLVDASLRQVMKADELQIALLSLQKLLLPEDRLAVMQFSDEVVLTQDWNNDAVALRKALRPVLRAGSKVAIYDALLMTALKLTEAEGQRMVFLLTSGLNTAGLADMTQALIAMQSARASVHLFTQAEALIATVRQKQAKVLRRGATIAELRDIEKALQIIKSETAALARLAEQANGKIYFPAQENHLQAMLEEVVRAPRSQYVLTYCPQPSTAAGDVKILVRSGQAASAQISSAILK